MVTIVQTGVPCLCSKYIMSLPFRLYLFYLFFSEALPFFLLLIDLAKASALAKFALSAKSQVCDDDVMVSKCMTLCNGTYFIYLILEMLFIAVLHKYFLLLH